MMSESASKPRLAPGGRSYRFGGWVYLMDDHMLVVRRQTYQGEHWRLFYRDIQAIQIQRDRRRLWGAVWISIFLSLFLLVHLAISSKPGADQTGLMIVMLPFETVLTALLAWWLTLGPTCRVLITTAMGQRPMPTCGRVRGMQKMLEALRPRIAAAQGSLDQGDMRQRAEALAAAPQPPPIPVAPWAPAAKPPNRYRGKVHLALGLVLLTSALIGLMILGGEAWGWVALMLIVSLAQLVLAIMAAVKQRGSTAPASAKAAPWLTIVLAVVLYILFIVSGVSESMQVSRHRYRTYDDAEDVPSPSLAWKMPMQVETFGSLLVGLWGVFTYAAWQRKLASADAAKRQQAASSSAAAFLDQSVAAPVATAASPVQPDVAIAAEPFVPSAEPSPVPGELPPQPSQAPLE